MNISGTSNVNFQAKVSPRLLKQLEKQAKTSHCYVTTTKKMQVQLENVERWGSPVSELVICKSPVGNYTIGLQSTLMNGEVLQWSFQNLKGRTELSKFLNLREEHIKNAEASINNLYKKYGLKLFQNLEKKTYDKKAVSTK